MTAFEAMVVPWTKPSTLGSRIDFAHTLDNIFANPIKQREHFGGKQASVVANHNNIGKRSAYIKAYAHGEPIPYRIVYPNGVGVLILFLDNGLRRKERQSE